MKKVALLLSQALLCRRDAATAFVLPSPPSSSSSSSTHASSPVKRITINGRNTAIASSPSPPTDGDAADASAEISKAPTLNGKMVLPVKAMTAGLKGHKVAAVYAILNSSHKRGSGEGWEHALHVDITRDLGSDLSNYLEEHGPTSVAHIRALSFSYPQKAVMQEFADGWRAKVAEAGGALGWPSEGASTVTVEGSNTIIIAGDDYRMDDEDDDEDDDIDHEEYLHMMAQSRATPPPPAPLFVDNTGLSDGIVSLAKEPTPEEIAAKEAEQIISPFEKKTDEAISHLSDERLELNAENVDKVLDEVRPYLISDGGNVSVDNVDSATGNVYLLLEGACGSCASSTVTMQMGIERVLREKFGEALGEVAQVDPEGADGDDGGDPKELTMEAVQVEVKRISQAIVAMGGVVRVASVDPIGVVEIEYRGPNRVKKGLELALLDVEYVKHVKFVS